jgi:Tfp pilus assembly protein PilZ
MEPLERTELNKVDRRKHPRFVKRLETRIVSDHISFWSISSDLSKSGLFIRTNRGLNIDTTIDIELSLPDNRISLLKGIVRRTTRTGISSMKNGMGVEIIEKDQPFIDFVNSVMGEKEEYLGKKHIAREWQRDSCIPYEYELGNKDLRHTARERRQHRRLKVEHMKVNSEMPSATDVKIIDISKSGVFVKADRKLEIGKKYALKIAYENKVLFVKATVIWSFLTDNAEDANGIIIPIYIAGMQFTDVLKGEITDILNLIEADTEGAISHSSVAVFEKNGV